MKTLQFDSKITSFENINPMLSRVKVRISYWGLNRNNSYISKQTFINSLETIKHIPIVAEYNESVEDFRGHGGKLEVTDSGIKWVQTTRPYGFIDSNSEITWEEVTEEDGTVREYLCATGYLWTGRYPELNAVIENSKSQSMEIEIQNGQYAQIDGIKCYSINDFIWSALCILGDDVEPCFESSEIMAYALDKEEFEQQFSRMLFELNQYLEGGKSVPKEDFSLTSEQLEDELRKELSEIETISDPYWEEYTYPRYSFVDSMPDSMVVVAWDNKECCLVGANYSVASDNVEIDAATLQRYKVNGYVPMDLSNDPDPEVDSFRLVSADVIEHRLKSKEAELNKQFGKVKEQLASEVSELKAQNDDLDGKVKNYEMKERQTAEDELFASFSKELTEEEMSVVKSKKSEMSLEVMETMLYSLVGKKKAKFTKAVDDKPLRIRSPIADKTNNRNSDKVWADLVPIKSED